MLIAFLVIYLPIVILPSLIGMWTSGKKILKLDRELPTILLLISSALFMFLPFSLYSEPIGLLRILSLLLFAWLLYSAQNGNIRALKYSLFGIALNAVLITELFTP